MNDRHEDFRREPSKPHQCLHFSYETGVRCRAIAMHNFYMCYAHRDDVIPTVITNEPFLIDRLDTRDDLQRAFLEVVSRLASNRMDFRRAGLLGYHLHGALQNLNAAPDHVLKSTPDPIELEDGPPSPELVKAARAARGDREDDEEASPEQPTREARPEQHEVPSPVGCETIAQQSPLGAPSLSPLSGDRVGSEPPPQTCQPELGAPFATASSSPVGCEPTPAKQEESPEPYRVCPNQPRVPIPPSCFAPPERWSQYEAERASYDAAVAARYAKKRGLPPPDNESLSINAVADSPLGAQRIKNRTKRHLRTQNGPPARTLRILIATTYQYSSCSDSRKSKRRHL